MIDVDVMRGGDYGASALIYKPLSQDTSMYLQRHLDSTLQSIRNVGNNFVDAVKGLYNRFSSSDAINRAKMYLHNAGMHLSQDVIYPVKYDRYTVNLIMQRYIMSYPEVNELYRKNKCNGFQDSFLDPEPGAYGTDRFDYQRVMDGWMQFEKDEEQIAYFNHFSNSDEEPELNVLDQIAIRDTWDTVARLIAEGVDPTDPNGNKL